MVYRQSATYTFDCGVCGGAARYDVTGWLDGVRIHWDASVCCDGCPTAEETMLATTVCVDDYAMLREQGGWFGLSVVVPDADRVRLLKELRAALGLSMPEAARVAGVRTGPLFYGLEIEMRRVEAVVLSAVPHAVTTVARVAD